MPTAFEDHPLLPAARCVWVAWLHLALTSAELTLLSLSSVRLSVGKTTNQLPRQPTNQSTDLPNNQVTNHATNQLVNLATNQPTYWQTYLSKNLPLVLMRDYGNVSFLASDAHSTLYVTCYHSQRLCFLTYMPRDINMDSTSRASKLMEEGNVGELAWQASWIWELDILEPKWMHFSTSLEMWEEEMLFKTRTRGRDSSTHL